MWSTEHVRRNAGPVNFVTVSTTARLHLGFLDPGGENGRFGSIGLSLDAPRTVLHLRHAEGLRVHGAERERSLAYLSRFLAAHGIAPAHDLLIESVIPAHAGLGSGTQLAIAIGAALRRLHGMPPDPRADAALTERGLRSGIGIALFAEGGFVVDGGAPPNGDPPHSIARLPVPENWRAIVLLDPAMSGLSGDRERDAFAALAASRRASEATCRLVMLSILPALAESDLARFGEGVSQVQALMGDHFAPAQGGSRFMSARVGDAVAALGRAGAVGLGQSSWGPTGFAFALAEDVDRIIASVSRSGAARGLDMQVRHELNRGASVSMTTDAVQA
jgi:beta-ribofuranosylaminobenzene 5'-phosphate synthase